MDFAELTFKRIDGSWIETRDYVDWANKLLEAGSNALSIWELAVCRWDDYIDPAQVERLFQSCMNELGLKLPGDWFSALCIYSSSICQKMLQGELLPWECVQEMLTISDDYNEPYIHWIWVDLVDDLDSTKARIDGMKFNGVLDLNKPEQCIWTVARQFVSLCSELLPEKFPWIWHCEVCHAISDENTFTQTKTCTCIHCGAIGTMKNMRFFDNRDAFLRTLGGEKKFSVLR